MEGKGFIFDLDGVIVDTAKYHYLAWKELANQLGINFTEEHNELLKGVSRVKSLEILLGVGDVTLSDTEKVRYMEEKNTRYLEYVAKMDESEILPGIKELLAFLKENKIPFSLGSASKNARVILEGVNLLDAFTAIVDGNDVSKAKPDPEVFLIAAEKLKLEPKNCIVIEDAAAGIEAAKRANMKSVGIGEEEMLGAADVLLDSTAKLTVALAKELLN
ncbi:beta-phosphoglucomutase [Flavicella sp.]|uniref:beta-phosphoglucomutase n=1 Tax=Flavicella sp. TaxID=2957742 RepID=UPI00261ABF24|nr:beta-phosphoglucomutase [Flavicella sp.]MDG1804504.1 beta-phosphoglucomutase [Flavicella sp.]MDG2281105.1 beta-phosphoglucomutase [Flavicella sp.]